MARGDVHLVASFQQKALSGVSFNLATDTLKLGIINSTVAPSVTVADPRWGAGGSTDLSANQVAIGTGYTGPITLTGDTFTLTGAVSALKANNVVIPQDASGFSNAYWGALLDATTPGNYVIGYVDLGGPVGNVNGPINLNWSASGIETFTAA